MRGVADRRLRRRANPRPCRGESGDELRPGDPERHRGRRVGRGPLPGRRGGAPRADRRHRPHPGAGSPGDRRRGPRRHPRLHRRPHPHGRPGALGPARHLLVLARRDLGGHGQLRLHAGPGPGRPAPPRRAQPRAGRGHLGRGHGRGHRLDLGDLPRVPRHARPAAQGHQLRRLRRPLGPAHLGDGRAGLRGGRRPRTTSRVMARELRDALRAGAIGFTTSPHVQPPDLRRPPGRLPPRPPGTRSPRWSA